MGHSTYFLVEILGVSEICRLNVKAEEDPKEARAAVAQFNALVAAP